MQYKGKSVYSPLCYIISGICYIIRRIAGMMVNKQLRADATACRVTEGRKYVTFLKLII
jgi:tRNA threonylcarbamoyladenosine modification (KEOPS) complex Cgi121 subunit